MILYFEIEIIDKSNDKSKWLIISRFWNWYVINYIISIWLPKKEDDASLNSSRLCDDTS